MGLGQVRLQTQRFHRRGQRFFLSRRCRIEGVIAPIVDPGQSGKRSRKVWVKFRGLFKKLLRLFGVTAESVRPVAQLASLYERQIGFAIFSGPAFDLRLLHWRQFRLNSRTICWARSVWM